MLQIARNTISNIQRSSVFCGLLFAAVRKIDGDAFSIQTSWQDNRTNSGIRCPDAAAPGNIPAEAPSTGTSPT